MNRLFIWVAVSTLFLSVGQAYAHRDGCHRWHSCPSDSGSYVCGDLGYDDYCPNSSPSASQTTQSRPPSSQPTETAFQRYMQIGYTASTQGDYQTALINFRRALAEQPGNSYASKAIENMEAAIDAQR